MLRRLLLILALLVIPAAAGAQTFPKRDDSGVIDGANLLTPQQRQLLSQKLIAQKKASGRALVVATVPDLQGYDISDYGYRLLRAWGVGSKGNDGAILIIAPNERKVRIEVGYGLEGVLTDALSSQIIRNSITPRFKAGDMAAGIDEGADQIGALLALPPAEARARAAAAEADKQKDPQGNGLVMLWAGLFIFFFFILPLLGRFRGGRRYRNGGAPVIIWGPPTGGSSWSGWGSGSDSSWGSGGGDFFGGGSGGGGGASGGW